LELEVLASVGGFCYSEPLVSEAKPTFAYHISFPHLFFNSLLKQ